MTVSDQELTMIPLRGKSGKAFIGQYPNGEKIFIKLNTTPILPALAKEQIAPQLLWVRRTGNGDTMSAQEWLDGRILTKEDMGSKQIVHILLRLHKSRPLVNQLLQLNYKIENPYDLLVDWEKNAPLQIQENTYLQSIVKELKRSLPEFRSEVATIVHGDIKHSNWVITTSGMIYLVDWDSVRLTDRMYDVAFLLSHYIPYSRWQEWLHYYGYKDSEKVCQKIIWYGQFSYLSQILNCFDKRDMEHVNQEIYGLRKFRELVSKKK
ncbi:cell cycle regulator CcrZ [Streptococcus macedonicus]|uniref:Putative choline kinase involved in LPS biosynthesis n=1 Tax=Streptococcus gallolyticus TaxID=315405 RepID=A0A380K4L8_9STRE|nr:phosphotransferase family protein [Streptococcus macedonicus]SUN59505.1 putative choline kinase involved in LPS biosynthesis [Streptococcus gallolyticus]MBT1048262.1 phosphotransferase family protein [Streptococcus macedonicus]MCW8644310.1 phosphotransferase family protein [Streptococcus macedonicus]PHV59488.1 aminoglycoside phosphotransferase [Streptococcus macedonicus]WGK79651.1 phosphotransferase family protein [Streptococcus macedonicus]